MPTAPLDSVIVAINAANVRLNGNVETLQAIGGQIVGNTQAFSQQAVNSAWRKFQARLADLRFSGLQTETVFTGVPPAGSTDPGAQAYINFSNYFDGAVLQAAPVLPQGMIRPYELTERATGSGSLFTEMDMLLYAIPRVPKANWNRQWLWRNQTLYLPGALLETDIALVYAQLLGDFADGASPWFQQNIPLLNVIDPFAEYICREIAVARGDMAAVLAFQQSAEDMAALVVNQDLTAPSSLAKASESQKMRDRFSPPSGKMPKEVDR